MLTQLSIKNFKSIHENTIDLGRVNVFIGENGCGKSNIIESLVYAGNAVLNARKDILSHEELALNGTRYAKSSLLVSNFKGKKQNSDFNIQIKTKNSDIPVDFKFSIETNTSKILNKKASELARLDAKNRILYWEKLAKGIAENKLSRQQLEEEILDSIPTLTEIDIQLAAFKELENYTIYALNTPALRGQTAESNKEPLGLFGENLDTALANLNIEKLAELKGYLDDFIDWFDDFGIDNLNKLKTQKFKSNKSKSNLFFTDKYMLSTNERNIFSCETANEGVLYLLFYLCLFIAPNTPQIFSIDNIETGLNPHLCSKLSEVICELSKKNNKQVFLTTHNPAILDGLDLSDDDIRLFEVFRNDEGHTTTRRITTLIDNFPKAMLSELAPRFKLSELWTRGFLGAISKKF